MFDIKLASNECYINLHSCRIKQYTSPTFTHPPPPFQKKPHLKEQK